MTVTYIPAESPLAGAIQNDTDVKTSNTVDGHIQHVILSDTVGNPAVDDVSGANVFVDFAHHELHEGDHFSYISAQDLTNAQVVSFLITTPNTTKWGHFSFDVSAEGEFDLKMYEGATPDADGSAVSAPAVINRNRNSVTAATLTITSPTLGAGSRGTLIAVYHSGGRQIGGTSGTGSEIILKQNTKYWFDLTNATALNNYVSWVVDWYEHTSNA